MKKNISQVEVEKVAGLSRIILKAEEKKKFAVNLSDILEYFKDLDKADGNLAVVDHYEMKDNQLRADEVKEVSETEKEAIRKLFSAREGNYLKVKVIL